MNFFKDIVTKHSRGSARITLLYIHIPSVLYNIVLVLVRKLYGRLNISFLTLF